MKATLGYLLVISLALVAAGLVVKPAADAQVLEIQAHTSEHQTSS